MRNCYLQIIKIDTTLGIDFPAELHDQSPRGGIRCELERSVSSGGSSIFISHFNLISPGEWNFDQFGLVDYPNVNVIIMKPTYIHYSCIVVASDQCGQSWTTLWLFTVSSP